MAPAPTTKKRRWPWMLLSAVIVTTIFVALSSMVSRPAEDSPSDTAINACQDTVQGKLAAPSSAKFTGDDVVVEDAFDTWTVAGSVDSQNAFGVMLRAEYTCNVRHEGGTRYSVAVESLT